MTIDALFRRRLISNWKQRMAAWRLVVDWTIALYFVIPILGIIIYNYIALWTQSAAWASFIPLVAIYFLFFLNTCRGELQYFLEEGDQLFLRQRSKWIIGLRKRGVTYSLLKSALVTDLLAYAMLPLLLYEFNWSVMQVFVCALFSFICKLYTIILRQNIENNTTRFRRFFYQLLLYMALALVFFSAMVYLTDRPLILSAICMAAIYPLYRFMQEMTVDQQYFAAEIQREQRAIEKSRSFAMGQAGIKRKGWYTPTKPLIFRKSTRFFKQRTAVNIIAESAFKSFFRRWSLVQLYLQYTVLICIAILVSTPVWLKVLVWFLGIALLVYWLKSYWKEVLDSAYYKLLKFSFGTLMKAEEKTLLMLILPSYTLVTAVSVLTIIL